MFVERDVSENDKISRKRKKNIVKVVETPLKNVKKNKTDTSKDGKKKTKGTLRLVFAKKSKAIFQTTGGGLIYLILALCLEHGCIFCKFDPAEGGGGGEGVKKKVCG